MLVWCYLYATVWVTWLKAARVIFDFPCGPTPFWRKISSSRLLICKSKVSFAQAPCSFWLWLIPFRMTALCASGVGVFMSTVVPKQSTTLATTVLLLVMGGALSDPESIAESEGLGSALAFLSPFTWTAGENYLAVIEVSGGEEAVDFFAIPIMEGYQKILQCLGGSALGYLHSASIFCSIFGVILLMFGYFGLRFVHRGKQA